MDDFHKFLKKLDTPPQGNRQETTFKPRKFPKKQYHRVNFHYALMCIVIIVILIGGAGFYWVNNYSSTSSSHIVSHRSSSQIREPSHQSLHNKPINQKTLSVQDGERLLGRWVRKLNYPNAQIILRKYEQLSPSQAHAIGNRLQEIDNSSKRNQQKKVAVKKILTKCNA